RSGIAVAASEEVFVDAQHLRTAPRVPFAKLALESALKVALHRRRADFFPPSQPAAVDAVCFISSGIQACPHF
ncbi:MAG TPA: hypothetical protein VKX49_01315, partial [Bryobacteraceae bacterium]|nr:hypothetical protein [Bryobacteraceae bacterium]